MNDSFVANSLCFSDSVTSKPFCCLSFLRFSPISGQLALAKFTSLAFLQLERIVRSPFVFGPQESLAPRAKSSVPAPGVRIALLSQVVNLIDLLGYPVAS